MFLITKENLVGYYANPKASHRVMGNAEGASKKHTSLRQDNAFSGSL